jgi:hypothetical protein
LLSSNQKSECPTAMRTLFPVLALSMFLSAPVWAGAPASEGDHDNHAGHDKS